MRTDNICLKCGLNNLIDSRNLKIEEMHDENNSFYRVMYYECKECKTINVVQIDDSTTIMILRKLTALIIKSAKTVLNDEQVSKGNIKKKDDMTERLRKKRKKLVSECIGKKMLNKDKKVIIEQLTIN